MKIGEGHAAAMARAGFDELAQALQAFPADIHPVDEPGLFGSVTPAIATDQMGYEHGQDAHLAGAADRAIGIEPQQQMEMGD